ncbi:selenide, water dikinase SelD [Mongoliitalea daihaiensis]|uniref:selenide, water dikinase SelD n=1 Tax=Mongoliitalea daihaiensis TaxID=2782006 RepID=UPI001F46CEA9|nr:selenide, water dikinase SelD [Mongoliitalea daihaiensis]UJP65361.1 selenide, water dikinase SelD [Mongoliitalea daihaiensis]
MEEKVRLTQFSEGSGCGCKIAPAVLDRILEQEDGIRTVFAQLLVGNESKDDAAVYQVSDDLAVINTVDFFTPIVDDPFIFGKIAAANAVSDVFAMGGKPIFANAILSWPVEKISPSLAAEVMRGAREVCAAVGIPLAGGHSIAAKDPIFGLSVTGTVHPQQIKKNSTAQSGDLIYITKPLGIGVLATALKREKISPEHEALLAEYAAEVNSIGMHLGSMPEVHAMTDVTGFGILGHTLEMAEGSGLSAHLQMNALPMIEGVQEYIAQFIFPDNTYRNWNAYSEKTAGVQGMDMVKLCDPQTNGGLLLAVSAPAQAKFEAEMNRLQQSIWLVGAFKDYEDIRVQIIGGK